MFFFFSIWKIFSVSFQEFSSSDWSLLSRSTTYIFYFPFCFPAFWNYKLGLTFSFLFLYFLIIFSFAIFFVCLQSISHKFSSKYISAAQFGVLGHVFFNQNILHSLIETSFSLLCPLSSYSILNVLMTTVSAPHSFMNWTEIPDTENFLLWLFFRAPEANSSCCPSYGDEEKGEDSKCR